VIVIAGQVCVELNHLCVDPGQQHRPGRGARGHPDTTPWARGRAALRAAARPRRGSLGR
jgi:hypothetical protein